MQVWSASAFDVASDFRSKTMVSTSNTNLATSTGASVSRGEVPRYKSHTTNSDALYTSRLRAVFQCRRVCLKTSGRVAMATSVSRVAMSTTRTCTNKTNWMTSPDTPLFQPLARRAHLPLRTETMASIHSTAKWFISFYIILYL